MKRRSQGKKNNKTEQMPDAEDCGARNSEIPVGLRKEGRFPGGGVAPGGALKGGVISR